MRVSCHNRRLLAVAAPLSVWNPRARLQRVPIDFIFALDRIPRGGIMLKRLVLKRQPRDIWLRLVSSDIRKEAANLKRWVNQPITASQFLRRRSHSGTYLWAMGPPNIHPKTIRVATSGKSVFVATFLTLAGLAAPDAQIQIQKSMKH